MRTALLVINFGGPRNLKEVEPFLYELFRDKDVIPLPGGAYAQELFADLISARRAPKTQRQYSEIGGGSPLVETTFAQVAALQQALHAEGITPSIYVGMRYTRPSIREALAAIQAENVERLIVLALYPHYSFATSASSYNEVTKQMRDLNMAHLPVHFVPAWFDDPDYITAVSDTVKTALTRLPETVTPHLLFSAHGLPVSFIKRQDPYMSHVQDTMRLVCADLGWRHTTSLSWQSRVGPVRWLSPATENELTRLGSEGCKAVIVVPVSFVGDHIETLYEIDIEYQHVAHEAGIEHFVRAQALDCHPHLIRALVAQVKKGLSPGACRPCVRCLLPKPQHVHKQKTCLDCGFKKPAHVLFEAGQQRQ